ncbi:MAG: GerAB/ArcD/ProY family transporter [Clostridiales bacterium]|nr:GerAB/ArcD/ProY family transporter [Clostridiales bacterium]
MFSNNEKISAKQLKRLIVIDLFSVTGIIVPKIAASVLGKDGVLGIILATVYALIFLWILFMIAKEINDSYLQYAKEAAGSVFSFIIGLLYSIKIIFSGAFIVRLFGEVIKATLLEDTDLRIIILLLLLVATYMASKGFEVRARVAEVIYFFILIPILGLLFLGLKNIEVSNLMPLFNTDIDKIFSGSYSVFLIFSLLDLLLFCIPMVRSYNKGKKKTRSVYSHVAGGILIVSIFNLIIFLTALGLLGSKEVSDNLWSTITTLQIIEFPSSAIKRQDGLIMGIWTLSTFTVISGFLYYLSYVGKEIFCISNRKNLLIPALLIVFGIAIIPMETEQMFLYYESYMYYIGMPISLVLPLLILLIHKCRYKWKKRNIKHLLLPFILFFSVSILNGCSDMTEIEDRDFIQAVGIDYIEGRLTLYYVLPDLLALTGQSSNDTEKLIVDISGENYYEIEELYRLESSKKMDFSHLKAVIINKDIVRNPEVLDEFLQYIKEKSEISRNTLVFLSTQRISEVFSLNGELSGGIGNYLEQLYQVNLLKKGKEKITISELIKSMDNQSLTSYLPVLNIENDILKVMEIGILSGNELVYEVNKDKVSYFFVAQGYGENSRLFVNNDDSAGSYTVKIDSIKRKINFKWLDKKPYIEFYFKGKGDVSELELNEDILNQHIEEEIGLLIEDIIKNSKIDFMNLYSMTSYKEREMWFHYESNPTLFLEELEYGVKAELKLK